VINPIRNLNRHLARRTIIKISETMPIYLLVKNRKVFPDLIKIYRI
jgi:hypothetical protein